MTQTTFDRTKDYMMVNVRAGDTVLSTQTAAVLRRSLEQGIGNPESALEGLYLFGADEARDDRRRSQALYNMIHIAGAEVKEPRISIDFAYKIANQALLGVSYRSLFTQALLAMQEGGLLIKPTEADRARLFARPQALVS